MAESLMLDIINNTVYPLYIQGGVIYGSHYSKMG
jgi:hypothetical protein